MPAEVRVSFLPAAAQGATLAGAQVVIVDLIRASTSICAALHAGAASVRPVLEPNDAIELRRCLADGSCVLGGERAGILIPGFDLGNSPREFTGDRVRGRHVIFTTTNGTRAIHAAAAASASRILVGCLANLTALVNNLAADGRPVHILCAGTNGELSMEDLLCAGAIADRLIHSAGMRYTHARGDEARIAQRLFQGGDHRPRHVLETLMTSRGGRNLLEIGLEADIFDCARIDWLPVVPVFDPATSTITPAA